MLVELVTAMMASTARASSTTFRVLAVEFRVGNCGTAGTTLVNEVVWLVLDGENRLILDLAGI